MTNEQAYGNRSYEERVLTTYAPGDWVQVGPAYMMGGYANDGAEGVYRVVKVAGNRNYKLARPASGDSWDLIVHASRLTKVA